MTAINIIHGPNLNLLGEREPQIYGNFSLDRLTAELKKRFIGHDLRIFQSNHEGELIDAIHESRTWADGVVINGAGFSHTSIALHDAIKAINLPCVEVHLSNVYAREEFRHKSTIAKACIGQISGFGMHSYFLAISYLIEKETN